jgi:hypothetical protein
MCGRCNAGSARIRTRVGLDSTPAGVRDVEPAFPRPWPPRCWGGSSKAPPAAVWIGRTGPMRSWPRAVSHPWPHGQCEYDAGLLYELWRASLPPDLSLSQRRSGATGDGPPRPPGPPNKAEAGELVWLSQDDARVSIIPLRRTTLGLKGHRPVVGNLDGHDLVSICGALNLVTGRLTTRLVERPRGPAKLKQARSRQRCLQAGFARHLRDLARAYPTAEYPRVVRVLANAPGLGGP